jgi:N-acyl-L-homoserine lactone synthetase
MHSPARDDGVPRVVELRAHAPNRHPLLYSNVKIRKGNLLGHVLTNPQEIEAAQRLRHRVFVDSLRWVTGCDGLEVDEYDDGAIVLGVSDGRILRGTFRIVPPPRPFMLESVFKDLLTDHSLVKTTETVEVSRLVVDPVMTNTQQKRRTALLLYYLLYTWMRKNRMRYCYLVSTHKLMVSLRRIYDVPVETLGRTALTGERDSYQAAVIDMKGIFDWRHRVQYAVQYLLV